jgi:hypothetical protein
MSTSIEATAEVFWQAFRSMQKKQREAIVEKFLTETEFVEDLTDIIILRQRKNEPSRTLEEYLLEKESKKS